MSLITLQEALDFLNITANYFTIAAGNDVLKLAYDGDAVKNCDIADGTYDGDGLATAMQTAINAAVGVSCVVTYSSTTYKFTIAAPSGHTLAYTHTGSDAGWTCGFNQDHAAAASIASDFAVGDTSSVVTNILNAVEVWVKSYCNQTFESTTYRERVDGSGTQELFLDHYPIIALYRLSIDTIDGVRVKNTNTTGHASVSVNSTAVTLYKDGTVNTLALATYSTLTLLVAAINALSGWSASLADSDYGAYPSTCLLEQYGLQCINNREAPLQIPDEGESDFEIYPDEGRIHLHFGFPEGHRNIYIEYIAGYATIPEDLKLAVKIVVKYLYQKRTEESFGLSNYSSGGISVSFEKEIPVQASMLLDNYKRLMVYAYGA